MKVKRPYEVMPLRVWLQRFIMRCLEPKLALPLPSLNRMRRMDELQIRTRVTVSISPRERLRRQQRVKRYIRNVSQYERDMPGHIREKMA